MWSACLSWPKVLTGTCVQRAFRLEGTFNAGDVAYQTASVAACLHIMHVHVTCHFQPRARQALAMSALQSLVQAVQLRILMAPAQSEI